MLRAPALSRTEAVLVTLAGLLVVALLIELDRRAPAESLLALITAILLVVGWLAWVVRARVLRRAGRRRDEAIEAALDGLAETTLVLDRTATVLDASEATAAIFGYRAQDLVGMGLDTLAHPDDRADILAVLGPMVNRPRSRAWRIRHRDGQWVSIEVTAAPRVDGPLAGHTALAIHDVTKWMELEAQLTRRAFHDPLTGLPNRALYIDRLEHALGRRRRVTKGTAVLFIDLDDFKNVNDSLGHAEGDLLIAQVGERLSEHGRERRRRAQLGRPAQRHGHASLASRGLTPDEHFAVFLDIAGNPRSSTTPSTALGMQYQTVFATFLDEWQSGAASDLLAGLRAVDRQIDALLEQATTRDPRRSTETRPRRTKLRSIA